MIVVRSSGDERRGQDDGAYDPYGVHGPRFSAISVRGTSGKGGKVAGPGAVTTLPLVGAVRHG